MYRTHFINMSHTLQNHILCASFAEKLARGKADTDKGDERKVMFQSPQIRKGSSNFPFSLSATSSVFEHQE